MKKSMRVGVFATLSILGLTSLGSGTYLQLLEDHQQKEESFALIIEDKIAPKVIVEEQQKIEVTINLKEVTIKVNQELDQNIKSYIDNELNEETLARLSLDLSQVDNKKAGSYEYQIIDATNSLSWTGKIFVQEEEQTKPNEDLSIKLTLNNQTYKLNETLSTDPRTYISQTLTEEQLSEIVLDLSEVNMSLAGSYQYTIIFQNQIYLGKITIVEDQPPLNNQPSEDKPTTPDPTNPPSDGNTENTTPTE